MRREEIIWDHLKGSFFDEGIIQPLLHFCAYRTIQYPCAQRLVPCLPTLIPGASTARSRYCQMFFTFPEGSSTRQESVVALRWGWHRFSSSGASPCVRPYPVQFGHVLGQDWNELPLLAPTSRTCRLDDCGTIRF
jgi:hypothetical protein